MTEPNSSSDSPLDPDASFVQWIEARRNWIYVLAIAAALIWTLIYLQFVVDDAFISFRYGKNLVAHHIWNWNPSGVHEEAYTSFIYAALGILPALLHLSPALFFKLFGFACIGAMLYRVRSVATTPFAFLLGMLLIALHPWVWLHAYSGLETPLYMLLLFEMGICVHRAPTVSATWVYALFLLLPLTRPEGIVFACVGVALFWYRRSSAPKHYAIFALAIVLGLLYFFARAHYFHHLLPNPYYRKLAPSSWGDIRTNLINNFNDQRGYFSALLLICVFAQKSYTRVFSLCGILVLLLIFASHDMDMNYANRYYFQVAFPCILFFIAAEDHRRTSRIAAMVAAICLLSIDAQFLRTGLRDFHYWNRSDEDLGRQIAPFARNHTLLNTGAGVIPYYSNWTAYDLVGLGSYRLLGGLNASLLQELHPDLILMDGSQADLNNESTNFDALPKDFRAEIEFALESGQYDDVSESGSHGFYTVEFLRKDTPQHDEIVRALQQNAQASANDNFSYKDLLLQRYVPWRE